MDSSRSDYIFGLTIFSGNMIVKSIEEAMMKVRLGGDKEGCCRRGTICCAVKRRACLHLNIRCENKRSKHVFHACFFSFVETSPSASDWGI